MYISRLMSNQGRKTTTRKQLRKKEGIALNPQNYLIAGVGVLLIIISYTFLAQPPVDSFWSLDLAPVLLVIGYCIIIPIAIMYKGKRSASDEEHS